MRYKQKCKVVSLTLAHMLLPVRPFIRLSHYHTTTVKVRIMKF